MRSKLRAAERVTLLGIEHEYRVTDRERPVDFRRVIHGLDLGQWRLDPADDNAYRLPSGAKLTCDEAEAEIALAPISLGPGFARLAARTAAAERVDLLRRLPAGFRLDGHSTHISVAVPDRLVDRVARLFVERFALAHIALTDGSEVPGMAIRKRFGRVELCGDFIDGQALERASVLAVGGVLACIRSSVSGRRHAALPPATMVRSRPVAQRPGWYVDGVDVAILRRAGRNAMLMQVNGAGMALGDYLAAAWRSARECIAARVDAAELTSMDSMVDATLPLPFEGPIRECVDAPTVGIRPTVYGDLMRPRRRPGFAVAPVMVTWDVHVFMVVDAGATRRAFICIPPAWLESFLARLDAGKLDGALARCLKCRGLRHLGSRHQTNVPGVYGSMCLRDELVVPEGPAVAAGSCLGPRRHIATRMSGWLEAVHLRGARQ